MVPVDREDQVKDALRIPMSEELLGTLEAMVFPSWARLKVSRSSV